MKCLLIDENIIGAFVGDEMLGLCHHPLLLNAPDLGGGDFAGEKRVFAKGVVGALPGLVAMDIDVGFQHDVLAEGARVLPDDQAIGASIVAAESRGQSHRRGHAGGRLPRQDAGRTVGQAQSRYAEARHTGPVAGLSLTGRRGFGSAAHQTELLPLRHLLEKRLDTIFGVKGRERAANPGQHAEREGASEGIHHRLS